MDKIGIEDNGGGEKQIFKHLDALNGDEFLIWGAEYFCRTGFIKDFAGNLNDVLGDFIGKDGVKW